MRRVLNAAMLPGRSLAFVPYAQCIDKTLCSHCAAMASAAARNRIMWFAGGHVQIAGASGSAKRPSDAISAGPGKDSCVQAFHPVAGVILSSCCGSGSGLSSTATHAHLTAAMQGSDCEPAQTHRHGVAAGWLLHGGRHPRGAWRLRVNWSVRFVLRRSGHAAAHRSCAPEPTRCRRTMP